jgi:DnaK suppressor protein
MQHLTAGQRALLQSALEQRQRQLDRRLAEHHDGLSRAEHAHELLERDRDDLERTEDARQVDLTLSDHETQELGVVSRALLALQEGRYGECSDCGEPIPFDRLKAEPWAMRCVDCEAAHERQQALRA